jgi:hypothetical protein
MMAKLRNVLVLLLVLVGVPWLVCHTFPIWWIQIGVIVAVGLIGRTRAVSQAAAAVFLRLRHPSPRQLQWATVCVWIVSTCYLLFTAFHQHRELFPRLHDEHAYLLQSRMIAIGRLWEPRHPAADFFENFFVLSHPVYAPIYFPGTALLNAPFVRLSMPYWLMPLLAAGLVVALTYHLVTTLLDGVLGLVAAIFVIANWGLREFSTMVMSPVPMTLLGLLIFWAWLHWRRDKRWRWAVILGACMGCAAITRPVDAIVFALPVCIAIAVESRRLPAWRNVVMVMVTVIAAAPFLIVQGALNRGVTGNILKTPYTAYLKEDQPGSEFGFHEFHADARPASLLAQKQGYFFTYRLDDIRSHTISNLPRELVRRVIWTGICTVSAGILGVLLVPSIFGLNDIRRWVVFSAAPLFICLYLPNPFFLVHYTVPLVPIAAFIIALAVHVMARSDFRSETFLALVVIAVCISMLPELRSDVRDGIVPAMPVNALVHEQLSNAVEGPSVVLIRFRPPDNVNEEPVYNDDVVWPDDAPVIRAHDLGARNVEIARYYAARQPWRNFYLLDRQENVGRQHLVLHFLGNAGQFAKSFE